MQFDIRNVPFSRRGSWLSLSLITSRFAERVGAEGLFLRTVRDCGRGQEVFKLALLAEGGMELPFEAKASPSSLRLEAGEGRFAEICIPEPRVVRFRGEGVGLALESAAKGEFPFAIPCDGERWLFNSLGHALRLVLATSEGSIAVDAPWEEHHSARVVFRLAGGSGGRFDATVEECGTALPAPRRRPSFEEEKAIVASDFDGFRGTLPSLPSSCGETGELAAYIDWSCLVEPEDRIRRPAMFMSKNWMTGVWSWDHCFNAMALSYGNPELAWDQFMTMFDYQDDRGAIPDAISNSRIVWNFLKPPIHGWAIMRMLRNGALDEPKMRTAYSLLERWTDYWFDSRDYDGDGLPQYDHGNDSGWDNSTVFASMPPVESPDLTTFLVLQMDCLALLAGKLGMAEAEREWRRRAAETHERALGAFSRGGAMLPMNAVSHERIESRSLLPYFQLLLGERLPRACRDELVASLKSGGFVTEWGIATESVESPEYRSDGYWRGPIWAPSTLLIVDALEAAGEAALAGETARRFLKLAAKSGFPENYDAKTGEALRDRAFTWTASVYLILAHEYGEG